jgi:hypothetical protein
VELALVRMVAWYLRDDLNAAGRSNQPQRAAVLGACVDLGCDSRVVSTFHGPVATWTSVGCDASDGTFALAGCWAPGLGAGAKRRV